MKGMLRKGILRTGCDRMQPALKHARPAPSKQGAGCSRACLSNAAWSVQRSSRSRCPFAAISAQRSLRASGRRALKCQASSQADVLPATLPVFTCNADEVLAPGTTRVMQVYETKQLRLLEDVMMSRSQLMGYFVYEDGQDPSLKDMPGLFSGPDYTLCLGNLVKVQDVKRIQVGAIVRLQSEGRVQIQEVTNTEPFIRATLTSLPDTTPTEEAISSINSAKEALSEVLKDAQNLSMKFKGEETANLQAAMKWVDTEPVVSGLPGSNHALEMAYRLSFAALQLLPEMSTKEQFHVVQKRIAALETFDTATRLLNAAEYMSEARSLLAAKIALKTLGL